MAQGASGQIELSLSIIKEIKIPLPPLAKQQEIVGFCEKQEQIITTAQATIDAAKDKKAEIVRKYL